MHSERYRVARTPVEICYEIKKSRFIARLDRVSDRDQAMQMLALAKQDYPDARHHCWAYQLGRPSQPTSAAMSDDGEPSGTAGKPILNVIQHKTLGDVMVVVIRYFGGIKLGAGGLVRAYSHACQLAFDNVTAIEKINKQVLSLRCGFGEEQTIRHWLTRYDGDVQKVDYSAHVIMQIALEHHYLPAFHRSLASLPQTAVLDKD
jgi:uncharacterized YigZ family protein